MGYLGQHLYLSSINFHFYSSRLRMKRRKGTVHKEIKFNIHTTVIYILLEYISQLVLALVSFVSAIEVHTLI